MKDAFGKQLFNKAEVAKLCNVHRNTIKQWVEKRVIVPTAIISSRAYFDKNAIDACKEIIRLNNEQTGATRIALRSIAFEQKINGEMKTFLEEIRNVSNKLDLIYNTLISNKG